MCLKYQPITMKTQEELCALKEEVETESKEPQLSLDDLDQVTGGGISFEEYNKKLKLLDRQNWASRDDYVNAVNKLILEYMG